MDTLDRLRAKADHFLPGHDYEVFSDGLVTEIGRTHASRHTPRPSLLRE